MGIAAVMLLALALRSVRLSELYNLKRGLVTVGSPLPAFALMALIFAISRYPLVFMLYPLLMLVDWILGLLGSSIALCGACVLAVFLTEHGLRSVRQCVQSRGFRVIWPCRRIWAFT